MIADLVATHTGRPPVPVISVPPPDGVTVTDLRSMVVDSSAFRSVTGWAPQVPLRDALRRTVNALAARRTP
jgi:nucleoside-diphosphate-sugar epimerase